MIIIDMKMPQRCAECPCFSDSIYGHCNAKDIWLGADDGAWFSDHRPNWCPLQEQEAVTIKKTKEHGFGVYGGICPKCRNWIQSAHSFCGFCGQAVKWE